jgi:molecular chaperone DnaJ
MAIRSEWLENDYYGRLGVSEDASREEITRAYRQLARQFHPDTHPDDPQAEEQFKLISAAYDVIGDDGRRKEYDEARRLVAAGAGPGFAGGSDGTGPGFGDAGWAPGGFTTFQFDGEGLQDLLGDLFSAARAPRRGRDLQANLRLSFDDAISGTTTDVRIAHRKIKVRVPAGVDDGQVIRLAGKGEAGPNDGPAGDALVTVHVGGHRVFGRKGKDLTITVPITFPEAALGAEIAVPTFEGEPVTLRVPAGTPNGRTFRVAGRGVPARKGDLLVTVEVAVPRKLNKQERQAVEALAEATTDSPRADLAA